MKSRSWDKRVLIDLCLTLYIAVQWVNAGASDYNILKMTSKGRPSLPLIPRN
jgi:hypothetical protein